MAAGKYLVIGIQDMFFGIWDAFIRGMRDAFSVYSPVRLLGGIGIGGRGRTAQASDTTPVGAQDPEGTLLVLLPQKWKQFWWMRMSVKDNVGLVFCTRNS